MSSLSESLKTALCPLLYSVHCLEETVNATTSNCTTYSLQCVEETTYVVVQPLYPESTWCPTWPMAWCHKEKFDSYSLSRQNLSVFCHLFISNILENLFHFPLPIVITDFLYMMSPGKYMFLYHLELVFKCRNTIVKLNFRESRFLSHLDRLARFRLLFRISNRVETDTMKDSEEGNSGNVQESCPLKLNNHGHYSKNHSLTITTILSPLKK